ncbi:hypothetical protein K493DRAFT_325575 [Basidiobolus meristosporus CBS 931.73]|uniref:Uncharacterized protein n=1 Tax=Basidiobolus meristosporus CBS 931.73 TaxID=1314790 RepID=A0A1Y1Y0R1_9FUNG|nr:hypothetical protein K493DRAFT_325575 [Basidiobolus meristosporus CBS 931.73]|eukprot:ORX91485.1 hypothetical protein K493DRAFT_325575 [Basidiobolus meristosporus CBS 931.73]
MYDLSYSMLKSLVQEGCFNRQYTIHPLTFHPKYGPICLNTWDAAGHKKSGGLRQCVIIIFDLTSRISYGKVPNWQRELVDIRERKVKADAISFHRQKSFGYYDVSAKANHNFKKPFRWVAHKLVGNQTLKFAKSPALSPDEAAVDSNLMIQYYEELGAAASLPLPVNEE